MLNKARMAALSLVALLATAPAQAASVSYYLDQSDVLPDGTNWLQVTISDGIDGAVDFTVQILQPLKDLIANCDIGITKFAFNVVEGVNSPLSALDISTLPAGWAKGPQQDMDGFGIFDRRLRVTDAHTPLSDILQFSIVGVDLDTILSYVDYSRDSTQGPTLFAARVSPYVGYSDTCGTCSLDAFFGGATVVPLPAAGWLMLSGVGVLAGFRRRSFASPASV